MKKNIIIAISLTVFSAVVIGVYFYISSEYERIGDTDNLTADDRQELYGELVRTQLSLLNFEFDYYLALSLNKSVVHLLEKYRLTPLINRQISSSTLSDEYHRFLDSANNIISLKIMMNEKGLDNPALFDAVEFNYLSYGASGEILEGALGVDNSTPFTYDVISSKLIKQNRCMIDDDNNGFPDYMLLWVVGNSSLRASFDKMLYKIFYGRHYYNKHELKLIYKKMNTTYLMIKKCAPTQAVERVLSTIDYEVVKETYQKKLDIAKSLIEFNNNNDELIKTLSETLKRDSLAKILYHKVGKDSFITLGQLILFQLYADIGNNATRGE